MIKIFTFKVGLWVSDDSDDAMGFVLTIYGLDLKIPRPSLRDFVGLPSKSFLFRNSLLKSITNRNGSV